MTDDGDTITLLVYYCKALNNDIKLSHEHEGFEWVPLEESKERITKFYHDSVDLFKKLKLDKIF